MKKLKEPENWISDILFCKNEVKVLTDSLSEEQFNWKPAPKKWSVAECLDHLIVSGNKMIPYISKGVEKGHKKKILGDAPYYTGFIGKWFLGGAGRGGKPIPAPSLYLPSASNFKKKLVIDEFILLQDSYLSLLEQSEGLNLSRVYVRSAITPFLRFNLATWFQLMPGHQLRHFDQIKRVMNNEGFPK